MGGIIILDFIDMDRAEDKNYIFKQLLETLKADKAKTSVLKISDMGLVQMTRKRTEESLSHKISSTCPYCKGTGSILSPVTVSCEALRELERAFSNQKFDRDAFLIRAHPEVADRLCEEDAPFVTDLKDRFQKRLMVKSDETMHVEDFEIIPLDI